MELPLTSLSQSRLNLLEICPRKFQHVYFDQLGTLVSPELQERLAWGSRFHLLMQQRELGLPIDSLVNEDVELQHWMTALVNEATDVLIPEPDTFRESEHCRTLNFQGYLLTVIYDLLIESENNAQILDWKTYPQPKEQKEQSRLAKDWQMRLYLYVLAETSDYLPEQISMTYWFVESKPRPKSWRFSYDQVQHERTRLDLSRLLTKLTGWLRDYQEDGINFPQVLAASSVCNECNFAVRCQRTSEEAVGSGQLLSLADIEEVAI